MRHNQPRHAASARMPDGRPAMASTLLWATIAVAVLFSTASLAAPLQSDKESNISWDASSLPSARLEGALGVHPLPRAAAAAAAAERDGDGANHSHHNRVMLSTVKDRRSGPESAADESSSPYSHPPQSRSASSSSSSSVDAPMARGGPTAPVFVDAPEAMSRRGGGISAEQARGGAVLARTPALLERQSHARQSLTADDDTSTEDAADTAETTDAADTAATEDSLESTVAAQPLLAAASTTAAKSSSASPSSTASSASDSSSSPAATSSASKPTSSSASSTSASNTSSASSSASPSSTSSSSQLFDLSDSHSKYYALSVGIIILGVFGGLFVILCAFRWCFFRPDRKNDDDYDADGFTGGMAAAGRARDRRLAGGARSLRKALSKSKLSSGSFARRRDEGSVLLEIGDEVFAVAPEVAEEYHAAKRMFGSSMQNGQPGTPGAASNPFGWNGKAYLHTCLTRHEAAMRRKALGRSEPDSFSIDRWSRATSTVVGEDDEKELGKLGRRDSSAKPKRGLSQRFVDGLRAMREPREDDDELGDPESTTDLNDFLPVITRGGNDGGWGITEKPRVASASTPKPPPLPKDTPALDKSNKNLRASERPTKRLPASPGPRYNAAVERVRQRQQMLHQQQQQQRGSPGAPSRPSPALVEKTPNQGHVQNTSRPVGSLAPRGVTLEDVPSPDARKRTTRRFRNDAVPATFIAETIAHGEGGEGEGEGGDNARDVIRRQREERAGAQDVNVGASPAPATAVGRDRLPAARKSMSPKKQTRTRTHTQKHDASDPAAPASYRYPAYNLADVEGEGGEVRAASGGGGGGKEVPLDKA